MKNIAVTVLGLLFLAGAPLLAEQPAPAAPASELLAQVFAGGDGGACSAVASKQQAPFALAAEGDLKPIFRRGPCECFSDSDCRPCAACATSVCGDPETCGRCSWVNGNNCPEAC